MEWGIKGSADRTLLARFEFVGTLGIVVHLLDKKLSNWRDNPFCERMSMNVANERLYRNRQGPTQWNEVLGHTSGLYC